MVTNRKEVEHFAADLGRRAGPAYGCHRPDLDWILWQQLLEDFAAFGHFFHLLEEGDYSLGDPLQLVPGFQGQGGGKPRGREGIESVDEGLKGAQNQLAEQGTESQGEDSHHGSQDTEEQCQLPGFLLDGCQRNDGGEVVAVKG